MFDCRFRYIFEIIFYSILMCNEDDYILDINECEIGCCDDRCENIFGLYKCICFLGFKSVYG